MALKKSVPTPSSAEAVRRMRSVRQHDTDAEVAIRRHLHARGLRYRVNRPVLPELRRRCDILFVIAKVAVFVDGCFWHFCPMHRSLPKANARWWLSKLEGNRLRDLDTDDKLKKNGWRVMRIWEHEDPSKAAARIDKVVRARLARQS